MFPSIYPQLKTLLSDSSKNTSLELEARFNNFYNEKSGTSITWNKFNHLHNKILELTGTEEITHFVDYKSTNVRKRQEGDTVVWTSKQSILKEDNKEYMIRLNLSNEEPVTEPPNFNQQIEIIRSADRYSFPLGENLARLDLTKVVTSYPEGKQNANQNANQNNNSKTQDSTRTQDKYKKNQSQAQAQSQDKTQKISYEVEVEFVSKDISRLEEYFSQLQRIFNMLHDTENMYTSSLRDKVLSDLATLLGIEKDSLFMALVNARNLKKKDLVNGGLLGNPRTFYSVTFKADGVRKMLYFHSSGIWLIYPPYDLNYLMNINSIGPGAVTSYIMDTVFDGESVPRSARKDTAPKHKYWFLIFDLLSDMGTTGIQKSSHDYRMKRAQSLSNEIVSLPMIQVDTKSFKGLPNADQFYQIMNDFLNTQNNQQYITDGFIFTPEEVPYALETFEEPSKYPLHKRVLTSVPDICKWKPRDKLTIDFRIMWKATQGGQKTLNLLSKGPRGNDVIFDGSDINPFTPQMIDYSSEILMDLPSNSIVEFYWNIETNLLTPLKLRPDKPHPNRQDVALDVWEDIFSPITEETLRGTSFSQMFSYHNRIKMELLSQIGNRPSSILLDIGSGRGGDVSKWNTMKFKKIIAVEPNEEHIVELENRISKIPELSDKVVIVPCGGEDSKCITDAISKEAPDGVDAISLMLSMTFFWKSRDILDSLVSSMVNNLKTNGKIVFLTMDGDTVQQFFKPAFGGVTSSQIVLGPATMDYDVSEHKRSPDEGHLVYIDIKNSIVDEQYEYLVFLSDLEQRLIKHGFSLQNAFRAERESFLPREARKFTRLFTYGEFVSEDTTVQKKISSKRKPVEIKMIPSVPTLPTLPSLNKVVSPRLVPIGSPKTSELTTVGLPKVTPAATVGLPKIPSTAPVVLPKSPSTAPVLPPKPTSAAPVGLPKITSVPFLAPPKPTSAPPPIPSKTTSVPSTIPPKPISVPPVIPPKTANVTSVVPPKITIPSGEPRISSPRISGAPSVSLPVGYSNPASTLTSSSLPPVSTIIETIPSINVAGIVSSGTAVRVEPNVPESIIMNPSRQEVKEVKSLVTGNEVETVTKVYCSWEPKTFQISCMKGPFNDIHAISKAYVEEYQNNNSKKFRTDYVEKLSKELAGGLLFENNAYSSDGISRSYWLTSSEGLYPQRLMEYLGGQSDPEDKVDWSPAGLQELLLNGLKFPLELYSFIGDILDIDIYVVNSSPTEDINPVHRSSHIKSQSKFDEIMLNQETHPEAWKIRDSIVISEEEFSDVVAVQLDTGFQTVYFSPDPFVEELNKTIDLDEKEATLVFDPDQRFIDNTRLFLNRSSVNMEKVLSGFSLDDPFRMTYERLKSKI